MTRDEIIAAIDRTTTDPYVRKLAYTIAEIESGTGANPKAFEPNSSGVNGPMQVMSKQNGGKYGTFEQFAAPGKTDANNPEDSTIAGTRYLTSLFNKYGGDKEKAAVAYYTGSADKIGNIDKVNNKTGYDYLNKFRNMFNKVNVESQPIQNSTNFVPRRDNAPPPNLGNPMNDDFASIMQSVSDLLKKNQVNEAEKVTQIQASNAALGLDNNDAASNINVIGGKLVSGIQDLALLSDKRNKDFSGENGIFAAFAAQGTQQQLQMKAQEVSTLQDALKSNQTLALNQAKLITEASPSNDSAIKLYEAQARLFNQREVAQNTILQRTAMNESIVAARDVRAQQQLANTESIKLKNENTLKAQEAVKVWQDAAAKVGISKDIVTLDAIKSGNLQKLLGDKFDLVANAANGVISSTPEQASINLGLMKQDLVTRKDQDSVRAANAFMIKDTGYTSANEKNARADLVAKDPKFKTLSPKEQDAQIAEWVQNRKQIAVNSAYTNNSDSSIYGLSFENKVLGHAKLVAGNPEMQKYFAGIPEAKGRGITLSDQQIISSVLEKASADSRSIQDISRMIQTYYTSIVSELNDTVDYKRVGLPIARQFKVNTENGTSLDVTGRENTRTLETYLTNVRAAQVAGEKLKSLAQNNATLITNPQQNSNILTNRNMLMDTAQQRQELQKAQQAINRK